MRRAGSAAASAAATSANDCRGQRLNGLLALTCRTTSACSPVTPAAASRRLGRGHRVGAGDHFHGVAVGVGGADVERAEQIPLVEDRVPRRLQVRMPRHPRRVRPAPTGNVVADAHRRTARPHQERAARPAVEVDGDIVAGGAQPAGQRQVTAQAGEAARAVGLDDGAEVRIVANHRGCRGFDDVVEDGRWIASPQGADGRRGEHHVADQPQADEQDLQGSTVASSSSITGMSSLMA